MIPRGLIYIRPNINFRHSPLTIIKTLYACDCTKMRLKIKFQTTEKLRQCFTRHRTTSSYSQWSKLQSHVDVAVRTVL